MHINGVSSSETKENWIIEYLEWGREKLWTRFVDASQHHPPSNIKLPTSSALTSLLEVLSAWMQSNFLKVGISSKGELL